MLAWQIWLIIAGICLIIEIVTVGFLVFWFAVAALIVAGLSFFINNMLIQTTIFVILSSFLILFTRPFSKKITKSDTTVTNSNKLLGKTGIVYKEISRNIPGQVKVDGEIWTAVLDENYSLTLPVGSTVTVNAISGVKLIIEPLNVFSNQ